MACTLVFSFLAFSQIIDLGLAISSISGLASTGLDSLGAQLPIVWAGLIGLVMITAIIGTILAIR